MYCVSLFVALVFACAVPASSQNADGGGGTLEKITVPAKSLQNNTIGDPASVTVSICLPPGYSRKSQKYPVLYVLHGFSLHPILGDWTEVIQQSMKSFISQHPDKAFIVVIPNAFNAVDGSFYEDSPKSGDWDRLISRELVDYIDSHYRTLSKRESRAVAGHSMGGFGALRMVMLHPDVFSIAYALSPCCLDFVGDFTSSNPAWREALKLDSVQSIKAAAERDEFWPVALAAFAVSTTPNPSPGRLALYPYSAAGTELREVPSVVARWKDAMPLNMIESHLTQLKQARAIGLDYGYQDPFTHIRITVPEMAERLMRLGVPVEAGGYNGDHNDGVVNRVETVMIPFVAEHLSFASSQAASQQQTR